MGLTLLSFVNCIYLMYVCVFCGRCKWQNCFVFQSVVEHSHLSSEMFVLYLHQNYVSFYEDLDDIVRAYVYS